MSEAVIPSPVGPLVIVTDGQVLREIRFHGPSGRPSRDPLVRQVRHQLDEYFAGKRRGFDLPLEPEGTEFQRRVWHELLEIPYGQTISYGELARRVGNPRAARAVGAANGKNPLPIVIPCHRVIGSAGALTGFGGGVEIKSQLLALEAPDLFSGARGA